MRASRLAPGSFVARNHSKRTSRYGVQNCTRVAGDTDRRSFSDCDETCPIGYLAGQLSERVLTMNDPRQYAPATLRNRDFILGVLRGVLPTKGASSKSRAAPASTSSILRETSRISSSNPLIESQTHCRVSRHGLRPQASLTCAPRRSWTPRSRLGRSLRPTGSSASTWSTFHRGTRRSD